MSGSISAESQSQLVRVARGGTLNMVGAVVAAAAGFGLVAIVARTFDPAAAGVLFASTSAFLLVVGLAIFGADTGLVHFMLRFEELGRSADIPIMLRSARRPVLMSGVAIAGAMLVLADPVADLLGLDHSQAASVIRVLALVIPFASLAQLALSETRALGRMRPTVLIDNVGRMIVQVVGVAIVGVAGGGLVALTVSWALPYVLSAAVAIPTARHYLRRRSRRWDRERSGDRRSIRREFHRYSLPRGVARVSQIVIQRADVIVIAATLGAAPAAVYTAATRFVVVGQMAGQAVSNVLMPRLSQLLARRDLATVGEVFEVSTAWSMAITWPLYGVIASSSEVYLTIFGDGYVGSDGAPVVVTMCVAMMLASAAGALDTVLLMSGRSLASLLNGVTAATTNVVLCLVLIPWLGIVGAAVAWAVAVVVRNALAFVMVRRDLGLTPLSSKAAVVAGAVGCCYIVPLTALSVADILTGVTFLLALAIGTAAYAAALWRARGLLLLVAFGSVLPRRLASRLAGEARPD